MKKILIVLVGSQSLNNFLSKKIITSLGNKFDCEYLVDKALIKNKALSKLSNKIKINFMDISKIASKEISLLEKLLINLFYFKNSSYAFSFKKHIFGKNPKKILLLPFLIIFYFIYEILIDLSFKLRKEDRQLLKIFKKKEFNDCLMMTGGFGNFTISLINILKKKKINLSVIYPGMDNIYNKVPMYYAPKKIFVWGIHMKKFAQNIYKTKVISIGVPQYQNYHHFLYNKNKNLLIRENRKFLNRIHNLDDQKKIILYAGPVHPYDETLDLDIISETLNKNKLNEQYQILFRPHPHRKFIKADSFFDKKYNNIKLDTTVSINYKKSLKQSNTYLDHMTDPDYFIKLLPSVDLIISPLSTLVLEAAIFNKPCVVIGYGGLKNKYLKEALQWGHFESIKNKRWFFIASNKRELSEHTKNQLKTKYKKNEIFNDTLSIVDKKTYNFDYELVNNLVK